MTADMSSPATRVVDPVLAPGIFAVIVMIQSFTLFLISKKYLAVLSSHILLAKAIFVSLTCHVSCVAGTQIYILNLALHLQWRKNRNPIWSTWWTGNVDELGQKYKGHLIPLRTADIVEFPPNIVI